MASRVEIEIVQCCITRGFNLFDFVFLPNIWTPLGPTKPLASSNFDWSLQFQIRQCKKAVVRSYPRMTCTTMPPHARDGRVCQVHIAQVVFVLSEEIQKSAHFIVGIKLGS